MAYVVRMPALDLETEPVTLLEWAVDDGDAVSEGDPIAKVASAQRVAAIEAREAGVLRRTYLAVDESVPPETPIGIVAPAESDIYGLEAEATAALASVEEAGRRGTITGEGGEAVESATDGGERESMPERTVTAANPGGMRGRIEAGSFEWPFDSGPSNDGNEIGPTPVEVFLGGLASCLSLSTRYQADKRDAAVDEIRVETDATPNRGSVERIAVTVRIDTDEDDETVERIVDLAERGCHVSQLLREDLTLELSWERL